MGRMFTKPLPCEGSPPFQRGQQNQNWLKSGWMGYKTSAVLGVPNASEPGTKSEVAHSWLEWLQNLYHRGGGGGMLRSGALYQKSATSGCIISAVMGVANTP